MNISSSQLLATAGLARPPGAWRPLLDGEDFDAARSAVLDIAAALETPAAKPELDPSVAGGRAGSSIFHGYVAHSGLGPRLSAVARRELADAVAASRRGGDLSLYGGLTGVAWSAAHLARRASPELDALLADRLCEPGWPGEFDLVGGLVGLGVYALERPGERVDDVLLEAIVKRLGEMGQAAGSGGIAWPTPERRRRLWGTPGTDRDIDLGVAHGAAGVVAFLARAYCARPADPVIASLLDRAASWLVEQADGRRPDGRFGYKGGAGLPAARLAWCYGDAGVAAALMAAGRARDRRDWVEEALVTARTAARRTVERSGVVDAGLCHGSAGVAHILARLHSLSGDLDLADAARRWYRRTLDYRRAGQGVAGFVSMHHVDGHLKPVSDPSLLTGAAGVGLALLAATERVDPGWDRFLLLPSTEMQRSPGKP